MKKIAPVIVFLLAGLCSLSAQIRVDSLVIRLDLVGHPEVQALRSSREESLEKILKTDGWKAYDSTFATTPDTAVWLRFRLENTTRDTLNMYVFFGGHYYTDVYLQNNGEYQHLKNGYLVPFTERADPKMYFVTELKLLPLRQSQCYIKISNDHETAGFNAPVLSSRVDYLDFMDRIRTGYGPSIAFIYTYLIALCCIFIFALAFCFRLRKRVYFYYLGYLFFQIIYAFLTLQVTPATIANLALYVPYFANLLFEPAQFVFIGFYVFFILHLLDIKRFSLPLAKALKVLGVFCFSYAMMRFIYNHYWWDPETGELIFYIVRAIVLPFNVVLFFWIIYKVKHPLLKYFVLGQALFFIGAFVSSFISFTELHFIPGHFFNFPYAQNVIFQAGLLGEVLCFSIALGENVFLIQKEKEETGQKLIAQLRQNQIMEENMRKALDQQIDRKTKELVRLYAEMEKQKEEQIKKSFADRLRDMKMLALRSQMNPHFIFNSLNALKNLVMLSREEDAIQYLDNFSVLLRTILQNSSKNTITVEEELDMLELYLALEKSRMGEDFSYAIQCDSREALSQYTIPPLLLQPFVENAIWHGLHPSGKPEKKLSVTFDTSQQLRITIEDNGVGRKVSSKVKKTHPSAGTRITQERLSLYNHISEAKMHLNILDLENDEGVPEGTRITITYNG